MAAGVARAALGLPARARLALFFGMHPGKDPEVTFRASTRLPEWRLVVAGNGAAQAYRRWAEHGGVDGGRAPVLFDGYVDEATRTLLHAAVDLMVLSFQPFWLGLGSGGLTDARPAALPRGRRATRNDRRHGRTGWTSDRLVRLLVPPTGS